MKYIFVLSIIALLTGCSTAPVSLEFENSRVFDKSRDDVWKNLEVFFETGSIPVETSDKENGIIVAVRNLRRASIYADCGTSDTSSIGQGVLTVKISLQSPEEKQTRVTVDVTFTAYRIFAGLAKTRIECFSNGSLEEEIFDNL